MRNSLSMGAIFVIALSLAACHNSEGSSSEGSAGRRVTDSPLLSAAERNDDQTIKQLIAQGTNPNEALKNGRTALHIAAAGGQMRAATALLQAGANPVQPDSRGDTPLMTACSKGYEGLVREMLVKHPNINGQNKGGKTALYFAAEYNRPTIVTLLLQAGADPHLADTKGRTPMDVAQAKNYGAVMDALKGVHPAGAMGGMMPAGNMSTGNAPPSTGPNWGTGGSSR
jgi:ankyrin repeat protein